MPRRWYQTLEIDGVEQVFEDVKRADSKFWNEGKWDTFIHPLLPEERNTFIEIGCNAGLFLNKAREAGFERVIGIECNKQIFQQAEIYREHVGGDWELKNECIRDDFYIDKYPLADVVLISNAHYYMPVHVFARLVDRLRNHCLYCIIVSARAKRRQGNAAWDWNHLHGYFTDWEKINSVAGISPEGDPTPRDTMYSVIFKSNLVALDVDAIYDPWMKASENENHKSHELAPALEDFLQKVLNGDDFELRDTDFFRYWMKRESKRGEEWVLKWLEYKADTARDIQKNGMKTPYYFGRNNKTLDGLHRLCTAKQLGHKHIISRVI
jgi:SAM-dependent methyltransferase